MATVACSRIEVTDCFLIDAVRRAKALMGVMFVVLSKAYDANGGKHSTIELAQKVRTARWSTVEGGAVYLQRLVEQ